MLTLITLQAFGQSVIKLECHVVLCQILAVSFQKLPLHKLDECTRGSEGVCVCVCVCVRHVISVCVTLRATAGH